MSGELLRGVPAQIVGGFLEPAVTATDWRERWKLVNRAAGVIVGWAVSEARQNARTAPAIAQQLESDVEAAFFFGHVADQPYSMIAQGLRQRVTEVLVQMGK